MIIKSFILLLSNPISLCMKILGNPVSLCMKIINSIVVVVLYYRFLTTFSIGHHHFLWQHPLIQNLT